MWEGFLAWGKNKQMKRTIPNQPTKNKATKQRADNQLAQPYSTLEFPLPLRKFLFHLHFSCAVFSTKRNCVNIESLHPIPSQLQRATTGTENSLTENIQPAQGVHELYFTLGKEKEVALSHFL